MAVPNPFEVAAVELSDEELRQALAHRGVVGTVGEIVYFRWIAGQIKELRAIAGA